MSTMSSLQHMQALEPGCAARSPGRKDSDEPEAATYFGQPELLEDRLHTKGPAIFGHGSRHTMCKAINQSSWCMAAGVFSALLCTAPPAGFPGECASFTVAVKKPGPYASICPTARWLLVDWTNATFEAEPPFVEGGVTGTSWSRTWPGSGVEGPCSCCQLEIL